MHTIALVLSLCLWGQVAPDRGVSVTDIALIVETLDLDQPQRQALNLRLRDFDTDWRMAQQQLTLDAAATPQQQAADAAESAWRVLRDQLVSLRQQRDALAADGVADGRWVSLNADIRTLQREVHVARAGVPRTRREARAAMQALQEELHDTLRTMVQALDADIEAILTGDQRALWPPVRDRLLRSRRIRALQLPGADIDLHAIVVRSGGAVKPAAQQVIDHWAERTDALLRQIEDEQHQARAQGSGPTAAAQWREAMRIESILRDNTMRSIELLEAQMPVLEGTHDALRGRIMPLSHGPVCFAGLPQAAREAGHDADAAIIEAGITDWEADRSAVQEHWEAAEHAAVSANALARTSGGVVPIDDDVVHQWALTTRAFHTLQRRHWIDTLSRLSDEAVVSLGPVLNTMPMSNPR